MFDSSELINNKLLLLITGRLKQSGGQYVDEHLTAELANVLHDCRVDQLDADGQRIQVRVHLLHQETVQFFDRLVAPDQ